MPMLANFLRGSVRCVFPLAALAAWVGLLLIPQGTEVVNVAVERLGQDGSWNDVLFLLACSAVLSLSIWYSMRWLISAQMTALPLSGPPDNWFRHWLPRLCGAAVPAMVSLVVWIERSPSGLSSAEAWMAALFASLSLLLLLFYWRRAHLVGLAGRQGRDAAGQPHELPANQPLPAFTTRLLAWSLLVSFMLGFLFVLFPLTAPRIIGAASIAALALASVNLFGSFVLTYLPMRKGLPPLAPWVLLYAVLISGFNDNHGTRAADAAAPPGPRLSPAEAFAQWRASLPADSTVYVVAAEGGGIRAAYWTAAVLEALERQVPGFRERVFALSGVSGGSVGVAAWAASVRPHGCAGKPPLPWPDATEILAADFLAPSMAGLFYYDFAQRMLPFPVARFDRSRGLEQGWERAASRIPGRPLEQTIDGFYASCHHLPELLLNATVAETGQRAILSRLSVAAFADTYDLHSPALGTAVQPVSGLMHHSARFPLISPAGAVRPQLPQDAGIVQRMAAAWWPDTRLRLMDGGYFDNSGVQTAIELLAQIGPKRGSARPVLIIVSNEVSAAALCKPPQGEDLCPQALRPTGNRDAAVWRWLHESTPPLRGLYDVRNSHVRVVAAQAVQALQPEIVELRPRPGVNGKQAPLGWALSATTRDYLRKQADQAVEPYLPLLRARH